MIPTFNLLDEPWIPVRTTTGEVRDINLRTALLKASDYSALAETSPPNLIALYRLLLAVLHRALTIHHGKWTDRDRARWFRQGLPEASIRAYLEQWRERFWLFHPSEPFMQVAALATAEETRDKTKPWTQIQLEGANGNTPVLFDHAMDDVPLAITPARACCNLLGFLQFIPGGLVKILKTSDNAAPLANSAAVMPTGADLSETLMLGLHPSDANAQADRPGWERPAPTIAQLRAAPTLATGPNDRYTRQCRAVLLLPDEEGCHIRHIRFAVGLAVQEDPNAPDPMTCYRINREGRPIRVAFNEGRALWRELPSLVPDPGHTHAIPPAILDWATNLLAALGEWDAPLQVLTAGLSSDQAKLLRWRAERIELPRALLTQPEAAAYLRMHIRYGEDVYARLRSILTEMIAQTMPDPTHKDTRSRAGNILTNGPAAAVFFSTAERALPKLMRQIAEGEIDTADRDWKTTLIAAAKQSWYATRESLGDSPAVLRADARTWPRFRGLLKTLIQPTTEEVSA